VPWINLTAAKAFKKREGVAHPGRLKFIPCKKINMSAEHMEAWE